MANQVDGVVTIVQESRFQLTDDAGVTHLFILSHAAAAETVQLPPLQQRQARVRVRYSSPSGLIARVATSVMRLD